MHLAPYITDSRTWDGSTASMPTELCLKNRRQPLPKMDATQIPFRIGPYHLDTRIGQGGMARVFKGIYKGTHGIRRAIAVKCGGPRDIDKQAIRHEAQLMQQIDLPSVPRVYDVGMHEGHPFLVMELVHGLTLRQVIRMRRPIPVANCIQLIRALCRTLNGLRSSRPGTRNRAIIHADLKPANLMITQSGHLKLLDFGISQFAGQPRLSGTLYGTPTYMAPEQILRQTLDVRTDLFAVGAILYELVCGERMFQERDPAMLLTNRMDVDRTLERKRICTQLSKRCPALIEPILKCVRQYPHDRFTVVDELLDMLDDIQKYYPLTSPERQLQNSAA